MMKECIKKLLTRLNCIIYGIKYRKGLYIGIGAKLVGGGRNIQVCEKVQIMPYSMVVALKKGRVEIGEGCTISMFSRIASIGYVKFGDYIAMGPNVFIADFNHEYRDTTKPIKLQGLSFTPMHDETPNLYIGDGSWIGAHVAIVGNVHIGKHCVIGANSVVTKDIPDYSIAVGIPCKVIKRYDFKCKQWLKV